MRGPIASVKALSVAKNPAELQPAGSQVRDKKYAEKLKLAAELHDQGVDPMRWTAAQPADWATQQAFQKTGQKDDRHFAVAGRLYKTTPQVAASQTQGQAALESYLGAPAKPIEEMVDVEQVQLTHPTGRPHDPSGDRPDAHALNLHYARVGIDPASAHNGDPLPMESQAKLQQATRTADGSEIPLGIPGIYRGYDDGYFYAANDGTRESPDVQALRRKLAAEKAQAQGDASAMVANDNDPEIDEAVALSYGKGASAQTAAAESRLSPLISALQKHQKGEALSAEDSALLAHVEIAFAAAGIPIDLMKADIDGLKRAAAGVAQDATNTTAPQRPRSPVEAYVERVYGMDPDAERTNILPNPKGADGELTWDVSQWTAPQILYDLVSGFVTPTVAADGHPISNEEMLNLALMTTGGGRAVVPNAAEILASRRVKLYNGAATERSFEMDYSHGYRSDTAGNLTHDIDGNPLKVGGRIVGRSVVGGSDEALSPTEFNAIAKEGTGRGTKIVPPGREGLGRNVGAVSYDQYTRLPKDVKLSSKLNAADVPGVYGHEIGHVIDQLAGEIPVDGLTHELKELYNVGNNPNRARGNAEMPADWAQRYRPEDAGYSGDDIPREWMAEAIRIYMVNPSFLKDAAPKTAAAIRKAVNANPAISKIIQFNMGGAPIPSLPIPATDTAPEFDMSNPPPGYVYGKNFT